MTPELTKSKLKYHPDAWVWYADAGYRHVFTNAVEKERIPDPIWLWCSQEFGPPTYIPRGKDRQGRPRPRGGRWGTCENCLILRDDNDAFELKMRFG